MIHHSRRVPQDRQEIKYAVRSLLSGRIFVCFFACLLPALAPWILQLMPVSAGSIHLLVADILLYRISLVSYAISAVVSVLIVDPISVRVAAFFLTLNRDVEQLPSPLSVCDCFGPGYGSLVRGMLLRRVRIILPAILPPLVAALLPGAWSIVEVSGYAAIRLADWLSVPLLLASLIYLVQSLRYAMVPYLLADFPELTPGEAMRQSLALVRGRLWELLLLQLSFLGWMLLTSVTMMIGGIYAYPYIEGTHAAYYIAFSQPMPWEQIGDVHAD